MTKNIRIQPELTINKPLLKNQIKDLLESNIPEDSKSGLHNLLGAILDETEIVQKATKKKSTKNGWL